AATLLQGAYCLLKISRIKNAFYIIENLAIVKINSYYESRITRFIADYSRERQDVTLFVALLIIPITFIIATAIMSKRFHSIIFFVLLLPLVISFALGEVPSKRYLITSLLVLVFQSKAHGLERIWDYKGQPMIFQRIHLKTAVYLSIAALLIFFILSNIITVEKYDRIGLIKEAKSNIQTYMSELSFDSVGDSFKILKSGGMGRVSGGLSEGRLGRVDHVSYTDTEHLRVVAPVPSAIEGIYLKGYVASIYTGDSWEDDSLDMEYKYNNFKRISEDKFSPMNQVSRLLEQVRGLKNTIIAEDLLEEPKDYRYQFFKGKINVEYVEANKNFLYLPYFTDHKSLPFSEYNLDLYGIPSSKGEPYSANYYFNISLGKGSYFYSSNYAVSERENKYNQYEEAYRKYVYDHYTILPEEGIDQLRRDFSVYNIDEDLSQISNKISYIKDYLNVNTQYSLSPGRLPYGKDFVEHFLYENKIGYCSHYASAATLILRIMGVAARYVEGYSVGMEDINTSNNLDNKLINEYSNNGNASYSVGQVELSVRDYNAHAWVEVYIDNCGWIPVEFTPGSGMEYTESITQYLADLGEMEEKQEDIISPTVAPEEPEEATATISPKTNNEDRTVNEKNQEEKSEEPLGDDSITLRKKIVVMSLLLLGTAFIGSMVIFIVKYRQKRYILRSNRNQKALLFYRRIEKIILLGNGLPNSKERLE
ncbi:MAG TPA: transglutaminase domain-containing protein, partial [Clostridiales bacterium]|nr:transglutaminase domain-containing protein [Clostridiales bacterium]